MARIKSHLLLTTWLLAFASLYVMPFLWSPNTRDLFPVAEIQKPEPNSNTSGFTIESPLPPSFTFYELIKSTMTLVAAMLWFVAFVLMIKGNDRIIMAVANEIKNDEIYRPTMAAAQTNWLGYLFWRRHNKALQLTAR